MVRMDTIETHAGEHEGIRRRFFYPHLGELKKKEIMATLIIATLLALLIIPPLFYSCASSHCFIKEKNRIKKQYIF